MQNPITTCIWCNNNGKEVADFYCSVFPNAHIDEENGVVTSFHIGDASLMTLNGGPKFRPNPSFSFYVTIESEEDLRSIWNQLIAGGKAMMALDEYPWSPLYGWLEDQYGVCWQLTKGKVSEVGKQVVPFLMFCDRQQGQAENAIAFYESLMPPATPPVIVRYEPGQVQIDAKVVHSRFRIGQNLFMAIDGGLPQPYNFDEGISFVIHCQSQEEVDDYWNKITEKGKESMCGWCYDAFGVCWQIVPAQITDLLKQPERRDRVFKTLMQMKKLDIAALENA
ncbi:MULTISPECIES: VOC family protein [Chitinophagaceae]